MAATRVSVRECTHEHKPQPPLGGWRTQYQEDMCDCEYANLKTDCDLIDSADCDPRLLHGMVARAHELGFSRKDRTRILKTAVRFSKSEDFVGLIHHWMWDNFPPYSATYVLRGTDWEEAKRERETAVRQHKRKGVPVRAHKRDATRKFAGQQVTDWNAFRA